MSILAPVKLTAIGFHKPVSHPFLGNFEEVLLFAMVTKLGLNTPILVKDWISGLEKSMPTHPPSDIRSLEEMAKIAQTTQAQYVLTGQLVPVNPGLPTETMAQPIVENLAATDPVRAMHLKLYLYERATHRWLVESTYGFDNTTLEAASPGQPASPVSMAAFNDLLKQILRDLLIAMMPGLSFEEVSGEIKTLADTPLSWSYNALNYMVQAQKKSDNAEKYKFYLAAIESDQMLESAYAQVGRLDRLNRQFEKSVAYYKKALEISHGSNRTKAIYSTEAGIGCALLGKQELAMQWWQRSLQYDPTYINPYFNLANLYEDQEKYTDAITYFQKAQDLAPEDFRAIYGLARIFSKTSQWEQAAEQYKKQLAQGDEDPWCHSDIATCYLNLGNQQNAIFHLQRAIALDAEGEAGEQAKTILELLIPPAHTSTF